MRPVGALEVRAEAHRGQGICCAPDATICEQVLGGDTALLFGQHAAANLPAETLVSRGVGSGIAAPLWGEREALGVLERESEAAAAPRRAPWDGRFRDRPTPSRAARAKDSGNRLVASSDQLVGPGPCARRREEPLAPLRITPLTS